MALLYYYLTLFDVYLLENHYNGHPCTTFQNAIIA